MFLKMRLGLLWEGTVLIGASAIDLPVEGKMFSVGHEVGVSPPPTVLVILGRIHSQERATSAT